MSWFQRLFKRSTAKPSQASSRGAPVRSGMESVGRAFQEHERELNEALVPARRAEVLAMWRQRIDAEGHDYADLVVAYPDRQRIVQIEGESIMQAYLLGYMAKRGWIDEGIALQSAFRLGRHLRDQLRSLGVRIDTLRATLGTVVDDVLLQIVKLGLRPNDP